MTKANGCLRTLNPTLADKVVALIKEDKVHYSCDECPRLCSECRTRNNCTKGNCDGKCTDCNHPGGAHTRNTPERITITLHAAKILEQGLDELDNIVFHELLHAADHGNTLVNNVGWHKERGFPDPIYACYYACFGKDDELTAMSAMMGLDAVTKKFTFAVEPLTSWTCSRSVGAYCEAVQKYARICQGNRPIDVRPK